MAGTDIFVDSLRNRIRALNTLWERAVSDMTLAQVNHHERPGVLPIAFSFSHYIRAQDQSISRPFLRRAAAMVSGLAGRRRSASAVDALGREESGSRNGELGLRQISMRGRSTSAAVKFAANSVLDAITEPIPLAEVLMPQLPPNMLQTFCSMVIGPGNPLRQLEVLECFVYQHGLRHMGEVEHGRALVGLQGMTS